MPPTFIVYDATFVSVASLALTSCRSRIISVNDVPCGASAFALSEPVSSGGNSPFGNVRPHEVRRDEHHRREGERDADGAPSPR